MSLNMVFKKSNPDYEGKMLGNDALSDEDVWSILEFIQKYMAKKKY